MKLKTLFFVIVMHTAIAVSASPIDNVIFRVKINGKWGYVNVKGEYIVTPQFDHAFLFSDNGLACVKLGNKYGFVDTTGKIVIEPLYDYISIAYPSKHYYKKFRW